VNSLPVVFRFCVPPHVDLQRTQPFPAAELVVRGRATPANQYAQKKMLCQAWHGLCSGIRLRSRNIAKHRRVKIKALRLWQTIALMNSNKLCGIPSALSSVIFWTQSHQACDLAKGSKQQRVWELIQPYQDL
jgi:hypothetical protein